MAEIKAAEDNFTPKAGMIDTTSTLNGILQSPYLDNLKSSPRKKRKYHLFSAFQLEFWKVYFLHQSKIL